MILKCPHDGTWLNFFTVTEWWLERRPELDRAWLGKKLTFCCNKPQHQWVGNK